MAVENTRVGQVTDYDKLTLDIYTNGTLDADEGCQPGCKGTERAFKPLHLIFLKFAKTAGSHDRERKQREKEKSSLEMNIDELELSVRSYNCLKRAGINTVEELCKRSRGYDESS